MSLLLRRLRPAAPEERAMKGRRIVTLALAVSLLAAIQPAAASMLVQYSFDESSGNAHNKKPERATSDRSEYSLLT